MKEVNKVIGEEPVILVDDTDVIKPYGKVFQSLGEVKDGSSLKARYEKGYMVTELVALTEKEKHPVSLYSHIHSSHEKGYKSINDVTFHGMNRVIEHIKTLYLCLDRGYDANKYIRQVGMKQPYTAAN